VRLTYTVTTWEQDGCEYEIQANSHEEAASECVRLNYANLDYPEQVDVYVRLEGMDLPTAKFVVYAVPDVVFHARSRPIEGAATLSESKGDE
jgi:hypothetical protein